jgi:hypothetical protein
MISNPPFDFQKIDLLIFLLDKQLVDGHDLLTVIQNMRQVIINIGKLNTPVNQIKTSNKNMGKTGDFDSQSTFS